MSVSFPEGFFAPKNWEGVIIRVSKTEDGGLASFFWNTDSRAWESFKGLDKVMKSPEATPAELRAVGLDPKDFPA